MSLDLLFVLCRFIHFASVMQLFGVSIFTVLLAPKVFSSSLIAKNANLMTVSACFAALTSIGMLAIQAGLMGNGWQDTYNLNVWLLVLTTNFGEVWRWHILLMALTVLMLLMRWLPGRNTYVLFTVSAMLIGQAFIGHAAVHDGLLGNIQRGSHAVHLLSAAYWFGSLLPLLSCLSLVRQPDSRPAAIVTLMRFSHYGHFAVAMVVLTGIVNSAIILQRWPTDMSSQYVFLLLCKIALVAVMIAVAVFNRYRLVPLLAKAPERARKSIIHATWFEFGLALTVLLLVSQFATLTPV